MRYFTIKLRQLITVLLILLAMMAIFFLKSNKKVIKEQFYQESGQIGWHDAEFHEKEGYNASLAPWTTWDDALEREMNWYLDAPVKRYPAFVHISFMDGDYQQYKNEIIPALQNGMGIISYLKYWEYKKRSNFKVLKLAIMMGEYLINEANTPDRGDYPVFTRSTGYYDEFPLTKSALEDGSIGDNVIEPDKGGIAAYALLELYKVTRDKRYFNQAIHNAQVLVQNMVKGNSERSPWPFRVDSVTGRSWGNTSGNMVYILRTFDQLIEMGYNRFEKPRKELWAWILRYQLNGSEKNGGPLWGSFSEMEPDHKHGNPWAPLNMARYLLEKRESLDTDWEAHAKGCIDFAVKHFGINGPGGVMCISEQEMGKRVCRGGVSSTFGAVMALFYGATGDDEYRDAAFSNLSWMTYFIRDDGVVCDQTEILREGGRQTDCHTDVIHNFMDALKIVPAWATSKTADNKIRQEVKFDFPKPKHGNTYVIAHRGAHKGGIPENTLAAYKKAIELGCDFIEIDIRKTKDGKFVSVHDEKVDSYVKGASGMVSDFTLTELKGMTLDKRVGPEWKHERIPAFEEILRLAKGRVGIYLDLKEPHVEELVAIIKRHKMEREIVWYVRSVNMDTIHEIMNRCYRCYHMPNPGPARKISDVVTETKAKVIASDMKHLDKNYMDIAKHNNVMVFVDEKQGSEQEWEQIIKWGTEGIQTDYPEQLIAFLKKRSVK